MAGQAQRHRSPTLDEFRLLLETKWTRPVACQNQCDPPGTCVCQRHIVHVDAMKQWWLRKTSEPDQTKLLRLLDEMPDEMHPARKFPLAIHKLFTEKRSGLTVFSLLLKQNRGHLMDRFYDSGIHDNHLAIVRDDALRNNLRRIMPHDEVNAVLDDFNKHKWQFCPMELNLHMSHSLQGTKTIPPFCHKIKMGEKGGTASIYWVAVEKNFISDEKLRIVIEDSLYEDPDYGECYQMVLKSYSGNKQSVYELEKEAFSGLSSNDTVPIVRYLGCYTHDYGEGSTSDKTYNLLLECGERDLYQAWADETNVPPVRAEEIIRFWNSLFEVAKAVRHVHHLEVPRHGKSAPHRYFGWHADIKPDNILVIRGRLKLADFGYSRFAPAAQMRDGIVPTELIHGFTDTYGAPEVFRIRRADGTMSGVTQSIDTWSLGCVLSVAATWAVLGFQGVRQFEQLRQLSPSNRKEGITYDRFHDGIQVLPEVRKWHNYLRGHIRLSDTATVSVLDLVENNMLQTETNNRFELEELCDKLEEILESATTRVNSLKIHSRKTDPVVLQALYNIEAKAHQESIERRSIPLNHPIAANTGPESLNPPQRARATMQVHKERIMQKKPLGQTPYRREILEKELKANTIFTEDGDRNLEAHNGGFTDSPTDAHPDGDAFEIARTARKRNPVVSGYLPSVQPPAALSSPYQEPARQSQYLSQYKSNGNDLESQGLVRTHHQPATATNPASHVPLSDFTGARQIGQGTTAAMHSPERIYSHYSSSSPTTPTSHTGAFRPHFPSPPGPTSITHSPQNPMSPNAIFGIDQPGFSPTTGHNQQYHWQANGAPQLNNPSPNHSNFREERTYEPNHSGSGIDESYSPPNPLITVSHPVGPVSPMTPVRRRDTRDYAAEKQVVVNDHSETLHGSYELLPLSVLDLPYDVCSVRTSVDHEDPKGKRAMFKGMFGIEERKVDKSLTQTYGDGREIIFVVDNGASMFNHWPIVVFVAETLVKRAAGLDKNGVDLKFTIDASEHNKHGLKRDAGRKEFRAALDAAAPEFSKLNDFQPDNEFQTDMFTVLDEIVKGWKNSGKPPTTLLVLTDGVWANTMANLVDNIILNLAKEASTSKHVGKRPFSIQFIRFGEQCVEKLDKLDNQLCSERGFRDIVDHCSWRSTVEKMFKGSIDSRHDQYDPVELPITHSYPDLVNLFRVFNDESLHESDQSHASLLTPLSPRRSMSRSSSHSSKSGSHQPKRESIPPPRSESWKLPNRGLFSA
ncbi:hypothetical protein CC86DRAFT_59153 [Ophiobolus disseminans]|uniref:Protein kinase domain-containing protein n=1 Tax=Ophiobolus disseminans TaxID=1469910 RepID=A0A6A6ZSG6_9PLEO|nr:hypothetical protein CC86DRAFT_59153 [Ophiobolus disseminans]